MKTKGKHAVLSFALLMIGFIVSFSYQLTNVEGEQQSNANQWDKEYQYREQLIKQEERTRQLQQELFEKQEEVREIESELATKEKGLFNLVEDVEKLRMFAGDIKVSGPGIEVTLRDASYVQDGENINQYIVHDGHVHKVINELLSSGAKGIAINGQRLFHNSYIACVGPVITVDGIEHAAPFVVTAIGNPDDLYESMNLDQGVKDQLLSDNVEVRIEKKEEVVFEPHLGQSGQLSDS
ncbi:DUF881 domain-containing protein [Bacillus solimangrovi]|uniref:DUF881 domain-containing protein n=1 Tax=Bacillus solimangrovi TaxID=1305675 RepID=A0A1E5LAQ5_9BACI|nr:DUF881 domain-containing protein [Bacillus solimangrovi]OEH91172.1 hypothetical protein BFG57_06025 [Bacillus solimangrovi]